MNLLIPPSPIGDAAAALTLAVLLATCGPPPEPVTAVHYECARLIVGDGSVIENAAFIVDEGRIVTVGVAGDVVMPAGATHVDLSGMTVMPAIVDAHVHLGTTREALIDDLQRRAYFGVGAALSMGSDMNDDPLAFRDEEIESIGRFRSAGSGITRPEPGRREVHWVDTEEEARQAVREEAARNVDLIKIWVDDRDGQFEKLTPELYGAVIDEAHANDLRVSAHIFDLEDAKGLLRAGIDIFAHGVRDQDIDDAYLVLVAEHPDVVLMPNLPPRGVPTELSWLAGAVPDSEVASLQAEEADPEAQAFFGIQARNLDRLDEAGVAVALGTDGNTPWAPHVEMEDMVAAGMNPGQVIVAATRNAAAVLDLEDDMGTIESGKSADFVVLEANPLEDITNTRRIARVYLRGAEVDREALRAAWGGGSD
jgi:imidazolonepropionase-like amidohydrolase